MTTAAASPQRRHHRGWAEAAAAFRACTPPKAMRYGPGEREAMDLFLPEGSPRGAAILFHGGYWQALDRSSAAMGGGAARARRGGGAALL
jgi:hypothetical protein